MGATSRLTSCLARRGLGAEGGGPEVDLLMPMFPDTLRIVRFFKVGGLRAPVGVALLGLALSATGCGKKEQAPVLNAPGTIYGGAPRTVLAEPSPRQDVYIEQSVRYDLPPAEYPEALGYEELSNGEQVVVVEYVHTYPEEIETFPEVAWAGRTYYNVHGDFVYWSEGWGWCYYLGPPAPLVTYWNGYYPWAPYAWGVGYYGPGYYWGGVGMYGYHAYGLSVVHASHHHHHYHQNDRRPGRDPKPSRNAGATVPVPGNSTGPVHKGEPINTPRRTNPADAEERGKARRTNPPARFADNGPTRRNTAPAVASNGGVRANPSRTPVRTNGYTTASGQRITVVDPRATRTSPAVRRTPSTVGTLPAANAPRRTAPAPAFAPRTNPSPATRTNTKSTTSPRRTSPQPTRSAPKRTQPSWGSSYSNTPKRSTPSRSAPKRSQPSRSAPTRSAPKRSAPTRSAPKRSAPSRSAPKRSAPSRSAPKRSAPKRSAPKRSAPSRSAPKRSSPKRKR